MSRSWTVDEQFAEARLPEVVAQQLRIRAAEVDRTRLPRSGGAAQELPQAPEDGPRGPVRRQRGADDSPPDRRRVAASARGPTPARRVPARPSVPANRASDTSRARGSTEGRKRRVERRLDDGRVGAGHPRRRRHAGHSEEEAQRVDEQPGHQGEQRQQDHRQRGGQRPGGGTQRRAHTVVAPRRRRPPEPVRSHNRLPPSMAANTADATPIPVPATRSTLTPASWKARRTPAWYAPAVPLPVSTSAVRDSGEYASRLAWAGLVTGALPRPS